MSHLSPTAMVLAAGLGLRMRPLTLTKPKPLLEVGGRTMLDLALDRIVAFGIHRAVVNTHYLAEQIETHLAARKDIEIIISHETELLDTGGGIRKALPHFGGLPFFALNADLPWMDGDEPALTRMAKAWDPATMDALLLLMKTQKARGFDGKGDFTLDADGHARRKNVLPPRSHVMLSAQILNPETFTHRTQQSFSNNLVWDEAEAKNRLFGIEHSGTCYHVGTPDDWQKANELLASGQGWSVA
jgi:N-acetyl-alpha-D-muramate 1-phosphate uridylyltransferase